MRPTHIAVRMDPSLTSIYIHVVVVITMPLQRIEESPGDGLVRTDSSERRNALDRKGRLRWAANSTGPSTGSRGRCRRRVGESTSSSSPAARTSRARPKPRIIDSPRPRRAERERPGARGTGRPARRPACRSRAPGARRSGCSRPRPSGARLASYRRGAPPQLLGYLARGAPGARRVGDLDALLQGKVVAVHPLRFVFCQHELSGNRIRN